MNLTKGKDDKYPGDKTKQEKKAQECMGGRLTFLNRTIRTGFTEKERHLSQDSQKRGLAVNQKKSIPGRQRGGYKDPMGCQGVRQLARRPG